MKNMPVPKQFKTLTPAPVELRMPVQMERNVPSQISTLAGDSRAVLNQTITHEMKKNSPSKVNSPPVSIPVTETGAASDYAMQKRIDHSRGVQSKPSKIYDGDLKGDKWNVDFQRVVQEDLPDLHKQEEPPAVEAKPAVRPKTAEKSESTRERKGTQALVMTCRNQGEQRGHEVAWMALRPARKNTGRRGGSRVSQSNGNRAKRGHAGEATGK